MYFWLVSGSIQTHSGRGNQVSVSKKGPQITLLLFANLFLFMIDLSTLSNAELLTLCREYGQATLMWRRKFLGLLPEVHKRKLYEQAGCSSAIEFAQKIAGISEEQVRLTLNLERRFENKPALHEALVNGDVSVNKLARVVSIATKENAEELAEKAKILPQNALETLVRDVKSEPCENQELFSEGLRAQITFELSGEVKAKLEELHQKDIDINEIILSAIENREQEIKQEKETISNECQPTNSRYIPGRTRKILKKEYGNKCSIKTCSKPSEEIHHSQRFSVAKTHDPKYLAPLCKGHHVLAHLADRKYEACILRT